MSFDPAEGRPEGPEEKHHAGHHRSAHLEPRAKRRREREEMDEDHQRRQRHQEDAESAPMNIDLESLRREPGDQAHEAEQGEGDHREEPGRHPLRPEAVGLPVDVPVGGDDVRESWVEPGGEGEGDADQSQRNKHGSAGHGGHLGWNRSIL